MSVSANFWLSHEHTLQVVCVCVCVCVCVYSRCCFDRTPLYCVLSITSTIYEMSLRVFFWTFKDVDNWNFHLVGLLHILTYLNQIWQ